MLLPQHGICIAVKEALKKDSGVGGEKTYAAIVERLLNKTRARGETRAWGGEDLRRYRGEAAQQDPR